MPAHRTMCGSTVGSSSQAGGMPTIARSAREVADDDGRGDRGGGPGVAGQRRKRGRPSGNAAHALPSLSTIDGGQVLAKALIEAINVASQRGAAHALR